MLKDFRYAIRALRQNPVFTGTAIISIGLAIGANSAIFSFADALLLRPLAVKNPSEVVAIRSFTPTASASSFADTSGEMSYPDFTDYREKSRAFDGLIAYDMKAVGFAHDTRSQTQMKTGYTVSGNFFDVLGVQPEIGRTFTADEDAVPGRNPVIILAHDLWKQEFGADPSVIGRNVRLNGLDFNVVGVAPESFSGGVDQFVQVSFFVPFMMAPALDPNENVTTKRDNRSIGVKGRLRTGVSVERANEEIATVARSLAETYPATNRSVRAVARSEVGMRLERNPVYRPLIASLFVLVTLVLLIACCNLANLMLSRGRARAKEIATRLAIGASRRRVVRQLMAENLCIALAGGGLGLLIAQAAVDFFSRIEVVGDVPIRLNFEINERVLVFTLVVSITSAVLFGLLPALQSSRPNLAPSLKPGEPDLSRKRLFGRSALVTVQIAISLVLLIGASQIYSGAKTTLAASHGFRSARTLTLRFDTGIADYSAAQSEQFYKAMIERSLAVPGVRAAALSSFLPLTNNTRSYSVVPEGYEFPAGQENVGVFESTVDDGYFAAFGVPILKGRGFMPSDTANAPPVAVVNTAFAQKYLGAEPIGRHIRINLRSEIRDAEIVGVAASGQYVSLVESPTGFLYLPLGQKPETRMTMIVESHGDPAALAGPLRELARSIDSKVPILAVRTMDEVFEKAAVLSTQLVTVMFASASLMGLLLALVGLYAVVTYQVGRRTREIGIRIALGAQRPHVMRMVLTQASKMGITGIAIGLILSVLSGRALTMGRPATFDPVIFMLLPLGMLAVTFVAASIPARRAARISPLQALREE